MSTFGTIANWLRAHRDNQAQLRGNTYFKERKSLTEIEQENNPDPIPLDTSDRMDPSEQVRMRSKAEEGNRRHIRTTLLSLALVIPAMFLIGHLYGLIRVKEISTASDRRADPLTAIRQFDYSMDKGMDWLKEGRYYNAAFRFETALEIRPHDFWAEYGLSIASICECLNEKEHCEEASERSTAFIGHYPDSRAAIEVREARSFDSTELDGLIRDYISEKDKPHGPGH